MAPIIQSPLPIVTITRFDVSPGETISVQEFLRGLKRPAPKAALPCYNDETLSPISAVHDVLRTTRSLAQDSSVLETCQSYVEESIGADHSTPKAERVEALGEASLDNEAQSLKGLRTVRTYEKKRKQASPPTESLSGFSSLFCSQSASGQEQHNGLCENVPQAQTAELDKTEAHDTNTPAYSEPRSPGEGKPQALQLVDERHEEPTAISLGVIGEKRTKKRKRRRAPVNELALVTELPIHSEYPSWSKRCLKVIGTLNTNSAFGYNDKVCNSNLRGKGVAIRTNEANIGKSVTKPRHDVAHARHSSIDLNDFKFPPTTPKATRSPDWRLGSGFEGVTSGASKITASSSYRRPAKRAKTVRFMLTPLRPLELISIRPPTAPPSKTKHSQKGPLSTDEGPVTPAHEISEIPSASSGRRVGPFRPLINAAKPGSKAIADKVHNLSASLQPSSNVRNPKQSKQSSVATVPQRLTSSISKALRPQQQVAKSSQAIRPPSKSERNGWLKRRRRVSFIDADEQDMLLDVQQNRPTVDYDSTENFFEAYNATWYREQQRAHGFPSQDQLVKSRPQLEVQDSLDKNDSWVVDRVSNKSTNNPTSSRAESLSSDQEHDSMRLEDLGHESLELGPSAGHHLLLQTSLSATNYFSTAVEQLNSPTKGPHSVVRRKSQIQGFSRSRRSHVEKGSLELGVTPRLKRTMSNVPFRPPFKEI